MEKNFLEEFVKKALQENEKKEDGEKRKKHFQEIGRKGGLTQITQLKFFEISLWGNPKFRRTIFCVFW